MKTQRLTLLSVLLSISIVVSSLESVAIIIPVPGVKLGLANVVTILIMFIYGERDAFMILLMRIVLVGLLTGTIFNAPFYLSLSGGMVAYALMVLFKRLNVFSIIGISIIGAFGHSVGQIIMAIFIIERAELIYYFPYILVLSVLTGVVTGVIATRSLTIMRKAV